MIIVERTLVHETGGEERRVKDGFHKMRAGICDLEANGNKQFGFIDQITTIVANMFTTNGDQERFIEMWRYYFGKELADVFSGARRCLKADFDSFLIFKMLITF